MDTDLDMLTDEQERRLGTNPRDQDSDDDGLTDFAEHRLGTSPTISDTDGDGFRDGSEIAQHQDPLRADGPHAYGARDGQWSPTADDPDADGLGEMEERLSGTDPENPDSDGDGLGDWVEVIRGSDPNDGPRSHASGGMSDLDDAASELRAVRGRAPGEVMAKAPGREAFLDAASAQIGDPYRFGAETVLTDKDPDAFDSSELVEWAAAQAGITLPDGSWRQYRHLHEGGNGLPVEQALKTPGALLFGFSSDPLATSGRPARAYVAISLGNGRVIDVSERAGEVREMDAGTIFTHAAVIPELAEDIDSDGDEHSDQAERKYGSDPFDATKHIDNRPGAAAHAPAPDAATAQLTDDDSPTGATQDLPPAADAPVFAPEPIAPETATAIVAPDPEPADVEVRPAPTEPMVVAEDEWTGDEIFDDDVVVIDDPPEDVELFG